MGALSVCLNVWSSWVFFSVYSFMCWWECEATFHRKTRKRKIEICMLPVCAIDCLSASGCLLHIIYFSLSLSLYLSLSLSLSLSDEAWGKSSSLTVMHILRKAQVSFLCIYLYLLSLICTENQWVHDADWFCFTSVCRLDLSVILIILISNQSVLHFCFHFVFAMLVSESDDILAVLLHI